jgi:hypothetical protein
MGPVAQSVAYGTAWLVFECVLSVGAAIDDIVVTTEDAVGEPVVADELPDVFGRVELGAF